MNTKYNFLVDRLTDKMESILPERINVFNRKLEIYDMNPPARASLNCMIWESDDELIMEGILFEYFEHSSAATYTDVYTKVIKENEIVSEYDLTPLVIDVAEWLFSKYVAVVDYLDPATNYVETFHEDN